MTHPVELGVKCADFLKDNHHAYAAKARRKKISLIGVEVTNRCSEDVRLLLGSSQLIAAGKIFPAENRTVILRKLSAFTWDFLVYLIIDFHPVSAAIEAFLFLTGPIYNWRLRRHLRLLSDGEKLLRPGESEKVILGFRGVPKKPDEIETLQLWYRCGDGEKETIRCQPEPPRSWPWRRGG
jgi:hypothetical protein